MQNGINPLETLAIVLAAALVMAVVLGLLLRTALRTRPGSDAAVEIETLRAAKSDLEAQLAAEAVRASRVGGLETAQTEITARLDRLRDDKSAVDADLAAAREALDGRNTRIGELQAELAAAMDGLRIARDAQNGLDRANAQLREALEQERRQAEEKLLLLTSAREAMSLEFKTLAEDIMARHGDSFSKLNKEQIEGILTPLREKIVEFEQKVHASTLESATGRTALSEQIRFIGEMGAVMGRETKELTEALRGKSQTQGAWGEMVLNTILEGSGLRPDVEYTSQKSVTNAEGRRLRPDVIVRLPGSQHIVVDAKVSLAAFEALCSATEEEDRSEHLAQHLASVRSHILQLGSKEYHAATGGTLDYVLMFVPIEGALAAALNAEPELVAFAIERGVALTSPTTLMIALRTVANVWRVERRNHNAEEIAERAGRLYDKFVGFVADIQALGASMQRTRQSYDAAMGKLVTGKGNVVWQAETLREMGARAAKTLPAELIAAAEASVPVSLPTDGPGLETELQAERMPDGTMARPDQTGVLAGDS